jgi:hypothetical protein
LGLTVEQQFVALMQLLKKARNTIGKVPGKSVEVLGLFPARTSKSSANFGKKYGRFHKTSIQRSAKGLIENFKK